MIKAKPPSKAKYARLLPSTEVYSILLIVISYKHIVCFIKLIKIVTKLFSANERKLTQIETVFYFSTRSVESNYLFAFICVNLRLLADKQFLSFKAPDNEHRYLAPNQDEVVFHHVLSTQLKLHCPDH